MHCISSFFGGCHSVSKYVTWKIDVVCLATCSTLGVLGLDGGASIGESGMLNAVDYCTSYETLCDPCDVAIVMAIWARSHASPL